MLCSERGFLIFINFLIYFFWEGELFHSLSGQMARVGRAGGLGASSWQCHRSRIGPCHQGRMCDMGESWTLVQQGCVVREGGEIHAVKQVAKGGMPRSEVQEVPQEVGGVLDTPCWMLNRALVLPRSSYCSFIQTPYTHHSPLSWEVCLCASSPVSTAAESANMGSAMTWLSCSRPERIVAQHQLFRTSASSL